MSYLPAVVLINTNYHLEYLAEALLLVNKHLLFNFKEWDTHLNLGVDMSTGHFRKAEWCEDLNVSHRFVHLVWVDIHNWVQCTLPLIVKIDQLVICISVYQLL